MPRTLIEEFDALKKIVAWLQFRLSRSGGGFPPAVHGPTHEPGGTDPIDIAASGGVLGPNTSPPASTDQAFARWDGTDGTRIQDSPGTFCDDAGRVTVKALHIPLFDAGNSGTSKTLDWQNGNEQLLTMTGNCTLDLDNPGDGGRYVIAVYTGAGGFDITWPSSVLWPDGTPPTITAAAGKFDLITLLHIAAVSPDVYLGSFNQNY